VGERDARAKRGEEEEVTSPLKVVHNFLAMGAPKRVLFEQPKAAEKETGNGMMGEQGGLESDGGGGNDGELRPSVMEKKCP
jgi:hypothetical protein